MPAAEDSEMRSLAVFSFRRAHGERRGYREVIQVFSVHVQSFESGAVGSD